VNRDAKAKRAQADGIVVPADTPAQPIDESELLNQIQAAGEHNASIETRKARREQAQRDVTDKKADATRWTESAGRRRDNIAEKIVDLERQIKELRGNGEKEAASMETQAANALDSASELQRKIDQAEPLPDPINVTSLRFDLDKAILINTQVSRREQRNKVTVEALALERQVAELTKRMDGRETQKREAIQKAKMPIPGLGFGAGIVTYDGLPLDQASDAEQLRISVSIVMAANPKLRVIRIKDGSLLDDDSMAIITQMAGEREFQVWIERVDSSGKIGIVMEDGEVVADNQGAVQ
jgi:hypothetical protein